MSSFFKVRFLPFLIFIAILFLGFRINHFVSMLSGAIEDSPLMQLADAADHEEEQAQTESEDEPGEQASAGSAEEPPAEQKAENTEKNAEVKDEEEKDPLDDYSENGVDETKLKPKRYQPPKDDLNLVNDSIVEDLKKQKAKLEERASILSEKEILLDITEKRLEEKFKELEMLKNQLEEILGSLDKEQLTQIRSLVKIYESMKPKDAARIFDALEMDVLLDVADLMKEAKLASILAKMDDNKAKLLTRFIAERKKFGEK